ncbi:hypothetical protein IFM89_009048 [Coptis chinensis]|uniref:Uncharacterized protein n=1 Tax=Coptis chinensis TaxID=261450 RepID=A0A835MEM9_9MAGN|nr:hypothetical protein IFM89_009048 [Coptis chinensis]
MEEVDIGNIEAEEEYHSNNSSKGESDDELVPPQGGGENEVLLREKKLIAKYVKLINNYIVRRSSIDHVYMVRTQYGTRWEVKKGASTSSNEPTPISSPHQQQYSIAAQQQQHKATTTTKIAKNNP